MPYGGPRFEFFTQNQYSNHAASIMKEDATRAAAIRQRREEAAEAELQQTLMQTQQVQDTAARMAAEVQADADAKALRQRRLAAEARTEAAQQRQHRRTLRHTRSNAIGDDPKAVAAAAAAARTQRVTGSTDERTAFAGSARVLALSQPKQLEEPAYGALMYGRCMHQRGETVEFPVGRGGQPYTPGVDRDRLVPARPDLSVRPWEGSYSTQRPTAASRQAKEEHHYYLDGPASQTSEAVRAERSATVRALATAHRNSTTRGPEEGHRDSGDAVRARRPPSPAASCASSAASLPSVFSHGSSNGPIEATGTRHMVAEPRANEAQVTAHLRTYGGAMTASGDRYQFANSTAGRRRVDSNGREVSPLEGLSLPELSHRIVTTQRSASRKIPA